jgi:hypothetical protein
MPLQTAVSLFGVRYKRFYKRSSHLKPICRLCFQTLNEHFVPDSLYVQNIMRDNSRVGWLLLIFFVAETDGEISLAVGCYWALFTKQRKALCWGHVRPSVCDHESYQQVVLLLGVMRSGMGVLCRKLAELAWVFAKSGSVPVILYLRAWMHYTRTSHLSWPIWVKSGTEDFHTMPLSVYDYCENRCNGNHT